jgi:DNA methyltransferase 1-associated protein 1
MSDVKDILGMSRRGPAEPRAPKEKAQKAQRPQGMSREAFALLGDSHPIISSQLMESVGKKADVKAKPKPSTKGIPTWQFRGFKSSARTDGLELKRWTKSFKVGRSGVSTTRNDDGRDRAAGGMR